MGIILTIISFILSVLLYPFLLFYTCLRSFFTWTTINTYFFNIAIGIDRLGNLIAKDLFNDILIKKGGFEFGDPLETISSVLGKNYIAKKLTWLGLGLANLLDFCQKNHVIIWMSMKIVIFKI